MKRLLFIVVTASTLALGGASAASASFDLWIDENCDGKHDITGQPKTGRADGVCGG